MNLSLNEVSEVVKSYFTILQTKLWTDLQGLFLISFIIAFIASLIIEAIKRSDETVFLRTELKKNSIFIINVILILFITCVIVLVFDGYDEIYKSIIYILLIWFFSWSISVPLYSYSIKYLFKFFDTIGSLIELANTFIKHLIEKYKIKKEKEDDKKIDNRKSN
jgi:hypothetical protein